MVLMRLYLVLSTKIALLLHTRLGYGQRLGSLSLGMMGEPGISLILAPILRFAAGVESA